MNLCVVSGNLTRNPELKMTPSGEKVCNFGIGCNERFSDRETGELRDNVHFFEVHAWGGTAQNIFDFFSKGMPILIHGSLRQERWESESGSRSRVTIRIQRWEFMSQRTDSEQPPVEQPPTRDPQTERESQQSGDEQPPF